MTRIIERVVKPALNQMHLHALRSDSDDDLLVVPFPLPDDGAGHLLVLIRADDVADEVVLSALLGEIPPRSRPAVAILLARLTATYKGVSFGLDEDGDAIAITFIELVHASDGSALVQLFLSRFLRALTAELAGIQRIVRQKGKQAVPRVLREAASVLRELDV